MTSSNLKTLDLAPRAQDFLGDVIKGLSQTPKTLAPKYFYDAKGSALFDQICELKEYYVTRTELGIVDNLQPFLPDDTSRLAVIELGGASSFKFRRLRRSLANIGMYVPVDISRDLLFREAAQLANDCLDLKVTALCADYQQLSSFRWDHLIKGYTPVIYFPGSTIGNLNPKEARELLHMCRSIVGDTGYMLMGCDLVKPLPILKPAYDDESGITAQFNLNILHRINSELGGQIQTENFHHEIRYDQQQKKIEMHLVSRCEQTIEIAGHSFAFTKGESIHTEDSRKFDREDIAALAVDTGFALKKWWTDPQQYFAVALLESEALNQSVAAQQASKNAFL